MVVILPGRPAGDRGRYFADMRHIGSLLAGLVVAPLAWVLIAAGQPRTEQTFARWATTDSIYTGDVLGPLGLVVGAGLLLGLIAALRVSPVGPVVAGVFYLGVYGYAIREPVWVVDKLPQFSINGYRIDTVPPFTNGTIALAGAILVTAALSRRRWQKWPAAAVAPSAAVGTEEPTPVPESPAPAGALAGAPAGALAGVAAFTPNEVAPGPPPAVGDDPLWPSTPYAEFDSSLTRESMYAGLTPGTPEDLPRRTPPKRPTPNEQPPPEPPRSDAGPAAGRTPPATPLIPSPRHAAPTEGWPLDTWSTSPPAASPDHPPTASPERPPTASPDRPPTASPDRPTNQPTIEPTYQIPPATDLTQPVPPSDLTQPVPPPGQPTAGPTSPQSPSQQSPAPQPPAQQPPAQQPLAPRPLAPQPSAQQPPAQQSLAPQPLAPQPPAPQPSAQQPPAQPAAARPEPPAPPASTRSAPENPPSNQAPPVPPVDHRAGAPAQPTAPVPGQASPADLPWLSGSPNQPDQADPAGNPDPAGPSLRPVNPLAQRPVSPPPAGPPRSRPVNPLSTRPAPPTMPPTEPPAGTAAGPPANSPAGSVGEPSDSTQRLPGQATPADVEADEWPPDPPTASPWSRPPRPPQET
ncbi:hypothetical protein Vau01_005490 [Virgisporangium aurantiacum]|uniref:Uncharacterized protein n=2 Tax=Virgisporangium aurantiacum TaxID=175570 RepID=A0A8J3Z0U8_9ACTN|nr:hypothetical protein Vau01_005490 [Virgisporangium aurantiacum]